MKDYRLDNLMLNRFEEGRYEFDFVLDTPYIQAVEKTELLGGDVSAHALLTVRQDGCEIALSVEGQVQAACDRCLEPMTIDVRADERIEPEGQTVDLLWLAYETVIVSLPMVHCHPVGGCNPQMAALLQSHLRSAEEEPEEI